MENEKIVSFFYLKIFFMIVMSLVIGSIIARIGYEILDSQFHDNSFSLLIVSKDSKFISVDKSSNSAVFLALGDIGKFVKGKKPIEASFALGIPVNAIIVSNATPQNLTQFTSTGYQMRLLFDVSKTSYKNLDRYDILKLASTIRNSPKDNRVEMRVNLFDEHAMKERVGNLLQDSQLINMPLTIEIDNGTTINGLGNDLALILARRGFNVISVKTSNENGNSYIAYAGATNAYVSTLKGLTKFPVLKMNKSQAADITIFLGDDLDALLSL